MRPKAADYYGNLNVPLLDSIPASAKLVLEIGCGDGRLGAAHKARHPQCRVIGAELHPPSASVAAGRLDLVLCGAAETLDFDFLRGQVDCLVYGDVLEHLVDPWTLLARQAGLLSPVGKVVASIPNVQHWSLLQHLLGGGWTYSEHGILDDTHLRFFTHDSIGRLFGGAGLSIERTVGLLASAEATAAFMAKLGGAVAAFGLDAVRLEQAVSPIQYLVVASRRDAG